MLWLWEIYLLCHDVLRIDATIIIPLSCGDVVGLWLIDDAY